MPANIDLSAHKKKLGGNEYVMVSGRVLMAHADNPDALSIETDLVSWSDQAVVIKATVTTRKGTFTGYAASYLTTGSPQERKTPLEVAETSAIGRALGFAGYALENGIASADEMERAAAGNSQAETNRQKVDARRAEYVQTDAAEEHQKEIEASKAEARRLKLSKDILFAMFEMVSGGKDLADDARISLAERRKLVALLRSFPDRDQALDWLDRATNQPKPRQQEGDADFAPLLQSHDEYLRSEEELNASLAQTAERNIARERAQKGGTR